MLILPNLKSCARHTRQQNNQGGENPIVKHEDMLFTFPSNLIITERLINELLARTSGITASMSSINHVTISDGILAIKRAQYLVAEGELIDVGVTLGLLKNNQWAGQANITTPGKFKIVMKPEAGEHTATLPYNVPGQKSNNFKVTKLDWSLEVK
jgi:hypothetical protein